MVRVEIQVKAIGVRFGSRRELTLEQKTGGTRHPRGIDMRSWLEKSKGVIQGLCKNNVFLAYPAQRN